MDLSNTFSLYVQAFPNRKLKVSVLMQQHKFSWLQTFELLCARCPDFFHTLFIVTAFEQLAVLITGSAACQANVNKAKTVF